MTRRRQPTASEGEGGAHFCTLSPLLCFLPCYYCVISYISTQYNKKFDDKQTVGPAPTSSGAKGSSKAKRANRKDKGRNRDENEQREADVEPYDIYIVHNSNSMQDAGAAAARTRTRIKIKSASQQANITRKPHQQKAGRTRNRNPTSSKRGEQAQREAPKPPKNPARQEGARSTSTKHKAP